MLYADQLPRKRVNCRHLMLWVVQSDLVYSLTYIIQHLCRNCASTTQRFHWGLRRCNRDCTLHSIILRSILGLSFLAWSEFTQLIAQEFNCNILAEAI